MERELFVPHTLNPVARRKIGAWAFLPLLFLGTLSCASRGRSVRYQEVTAPEISNQQAHKPIQPEVSEEGSADVNLQAEPLTQAQMQAVGVQVLLGPGWFRTWAGAGALLEFRERGIPVRSIYAWEMSGVIAAVYAENSKPSAVSWRLQRLKAECFKFEKPVWGGLLGKKETTISDECVQSELSQFFRGSKIEDFEPPVFLGTNTGDRTVTVELFGGHEWIHTGETSEVLQNGLNYPGVLELEGRPCGPLCWKPGANSLVNITQPEAPLIILDYGRSNRNDLPCKDGSKTKQPNPSAREAYEASLCLFSKSLSDAQPPMAYIIQPVSDSRDPFDPQIRNEMLYAGKLAIKNWLESLKFSRDDSGRKNP